MKKNNDEDVSKETDQGDDNAILIEGRNKALLLLAFYIACDASRMQVYDALSLSS